MTVLVTGGGGFIGSHLARELVNKGEKVVLLDASPDRRLVNDILDKATFVIGDVSDSSKVLATVKERNIREIYHTAALLIEDCEADPVRALKVNVEGTANLLEACRIFDLDRIMFTSTAAVFSPGLPQPIGDDAPKYPISVYGATKVESELYGLKYLRSYGVDFRAVRFTWVYGWGRSRGATAFSSQLIEKPALGQPVEIPRRGNARGDWLYVKDAVRALLLLRDCKKPERRVYNIAGGVHTIEEVAKIVKRHIPSAHIRFGTQEPAASAAYDDSYARRELGWKPAYTIEEGVKDHIAETRKRKAGA
jgi:UDP-glucose 4-epimerase